MEYVAGCGEEGHVVFVMPPRGDGVLCRLQHHAWKLGKEEENFCREAEKPQWWFKVAAMHGRAAGGAL